MYEFSCRKFEAGVTGPVIRTETRSGVASVGFLTWALVFATIAVDAIVVFPLP
jgi:hypothetical protein